MRRFSDFAQHGAIFRKQEVLVREREQKKKIVLPNNETVPGSWTLEDIMSGRSSAFRGLFNKTSHFPKIFSDFSI